MLRTLRFFITMVQFKYILDKSSKKFICPSCNKRSFVKYIDSENSNYLNEQYGRCDRETNCRYHKLPTSNQTIATVNVATVNDNISYIGRYVMLQSLKKYSCNNFIAFLKVNFSDLEIQNCISKYKLGTSKHWDGATIFWQIDKFLKVRTGKIMLFNNKSGKRIKEPFAHIYWVHKKLNLQSYNLNQCLFGLHLKLMHFKVIENHQ